jgi:hypothetical protein
MLTDQDTCGVLLCEPRAKDQEIVSSWRILDVPDRQDHMATHSVAGGNSCIYFDSVLYRFRFVIRWLRTPTEPLLLQ